MDKITNYQSFSGDKKENSKFTIFDQFNKSYIKGDALQTKYDQLLKAEKSTWNLEGMNRMKNQNIQQQRAQTGTKSRERKKRVLKSFVNKEIEMRDNPY